jgi:hypothetical protein
VRNNAKWALAPVAAILVVVLGVAAFHTFGRLAASNDLASDLALVAAADLEMVPSPPRTEVVSPLEGGAKAGRLAAPVPKRKPGSGPAAPVEVKVQVAEVETPTPVLVTTTVSASPDPVAATIPASTLPPLPRPRPMEPRFPVGDAGGVWGSQAPGSGGRDRGDGPGMPPGDVGGPHPGDGAGYPIDPDVRRPTDAGRRGGSIVIRGGTSGHDPCIPQSVGAIPRVSGGVLINERGPAGRTTFPRR